VGESSRVLGVAGDSARKGKGEGGAKIFGEDAGHQGGNGDGLQRGVHTVEARVKRKRANAARGRQYEGTKERRHVRKGGEKAKKMWGPRCVSGGTRGEGKKGCRWFKRIDETGQIAQHQQKKKIYDVVRQSRRGAGRETLDPWKACPSRFPQTQERRTTVFFGKAPRTGGGKPSGVQLQNVLVLRDRGEKTGENYRYGPPFATPDQKKSNISP